MPDKSPLVTILRLLSKFLCKLSFVRIVLAVLAGASLASVDPASAQATSPYPSSSTIEGMSFNWSTHIRLAEGSDNWPITWADDNHQYTSWGDGGGLGGTNTVGRVSLGVARVEGSATDYQVSNIWGGHNAAYQSDFGGKSYGIIFIDGVLYMWVSPGSDADNYNEARLYSSTDYGATWTPADWAFDKADDLILPTILNFGQDYAGARDNFVYHYFIELQGDPPELAVQIPGRIYLLRVDKNEMLTSKSNYQYFNGLDGNGNPVWSRNINDKQPVFGDPNGVGWNVAVSYNAGLERYILTTEHTQSNQGNLGIFDAPEPWGPWTTVAYMNYEDDTHFAHDYPGFPETTFFWNFSNKWLSEDGKNFTLIFTGTDDNDSWNTVRGSFEVAVGEATPPPGLTPPPVDIPPPTDAEPPVDATPPVEVEPPADAALPTAPTNLVGSAVSASQISLAWTPASAPESDIASYKVYRNGVVVGTPSGPSFSDASLTEGTSYTYQVSAVNSDGVEGPRSAPITSSTSADTGTLLISVVVIVVAVLIVLGGVSGLFWLRRTAR